MGQPYRPKKSRRKALPPTEAQSPSSKGADSATGGPRNSTGTLTRRTRASRGSRSAAGWASPPGTPAALSSRGGESRGQAARTAVQFLLLLEALAGMLDPGHRAGPLGWSPRTTRFRERSSGGPPCPRLRLPGRAASRAPAPRRDCRCSRCLQPVVAGS